MQANKENYRELLKKWCEDTETNLKSVRDQLMNKIDKPTFLQWEASFFSFKKEVESEEQPVDNNILFTKGQMLYEKFKRFLEVITFREEDDRMVPIGGHKLPPLPYAYNALEPIIDEETMRLHHLKHHKSYVDGLNKAENELKKARETNNFDLIKHWERELAFNGGGHYLHTIFWNIMSPTGGGMPAGELMQAINESFGSFDQFKKQFSKAAEKVEGGGWAILVWAPRSHRLEILMAEKQQNLSQWDVIPLLALDVWEHAYYLKYKADRAKYVQNWWKLVNWNEVDMRFQKARMVQWMPF